MDICIDFDGTCVTHDYPRIGFDIGAQEVLRDLVAHGHRLVLFTMRSGKELEDAVAWFKKNEIPLYGIQSNPTQADWTSSPKAYAQLYIDDAALGVPLRFDKALDGSRAFVDWGRARIALMNGGLLNPTLKEP